MRLTRLIKTFSIHQRRHLCNVIREELTVQAFCDIHVDVPYSVCVKPLDVHKYHNCDLLRIELQPVQLGRKSLKYIQDGNNIKIFATGDHNELDATCSIQAPVKANLNITAQRDIRAGVFSGTKLILKSTKGSIFVEKFQGDTIDLKTENGDIIMKGAVVASCIKAIVSNTGLIKAKRLQGLTTFLKTNNGNITVDASYCDNGTFEVSSGDLNLQNLHKNSKINLKNGKLYLTGLDGQLEAVLQNSVADIQITRILEDSRIRMTEQGDLKMMLSDECQDNTLFEIVTTSHTIDPGVRLIPSTNDSTLFLMPTADKYKQVQVECEMGKVHIQNASWINMLKLNVKK